MFVLQIAGSKHWTVHRPVVTNPLDSNPWTDFRAAIAERVTEEPAIDTDLLPGDSLYLPRGWLHSARTADETAIHVTIGVPALTRVDVARAAIDRVASAVAELRTSLPLGIDAGDHDAMEAESTKALLAFADEIRDRAAELGSEVADDLARTFATRTRPAAVRPLATLAAMASSDTTRVRWRRGLMGVVSEDSERVRLALADRTIDFPAFCAPALRKLRSGEITSAESLPGLDAADGAVLVRRLLREAIVVPAAG